MPNIYIAKLILKKFSYIPFVMVGFCLFFSQFAFGLPGTSAPGGSKEASSKAAPQKDKDKSTDNAAAAKESKEDKELEARMASAPIVTTEELVAKPQEYLNKDVKFDAKFSCLSSLALDYKPAFRSSRNYLSFLVFRPNSKIPFSELKLAMPIPKEKDPEYHLLGTLKEGDLLEIYGRVFACPLDEPWFDVVKIKKLSGSTDKGKLAEDKDANDKDADEESPTENKHE